MCCFYFQTAKVDSQKSVLWYPWKEKSGEYRKTSSIEDAGVPSLLKELAPKDNIEEFMKIWSEFTRLLFVQRWNYTLDNVEYSHALFMSILPFEYGK